MYTRVNDKKVITVAKQKDELEYALVALAEEKRLMEVHDYDGALAVKKALLIRLGVLV